MTVTTDQRTELGKAVTRVAYFAEFQFEDGTVRVSTLGQNYTWGGYEWLGVGTIGVIDAVEETEVIISQPLNFRLNIVQQSIKEIASSSPSQYRGRTAKMYMCPLNEQFQLVDTPILCWRGIMDMMSLGVDPSGNGQVTLKCETSAYGLKRLPSLRVNAAQQKARHPTDTGFDYLTNLVSTPLVWVSINLQVSIAQSRQ